MNIAFKGHTFSPVKNKYSLYSRIIHFIDQTFTPRAFNWANRIKEEFAPVNIERNETFGDKYFLCIHAPVSKKCWFLLFRVFDPMCFLFAFLISKFWMHTHTDVVESKLFSIGGKHLAEYLSTS